MNQKDLIGIKLFHLNEVPVKTIFETYSVLFGRNIDYIFTRQDETLDSITSRINAWLKQNICRVLNLETMYNNKRQIVGYTVFYTYPENVKITPICPVIVNMLNFCVKVKLCDNVSPYVVHNGASIDSYDMLKSNNNYIEISILRSSDSRSKDDIYRIPIDKLLDMSLFKITHHNLKEFSN
jgi:hypothetical protein